MKETVITVAVFMMLLLFIPLIFVGTAKNVHVETAVIASNAAAKSENRGAAAEGAGKGAGVDVDGGGESGKFRIRSMATGKTEDVDAFDFVCGIVAGEMPAGYQPEALKAQAVAAFSYCAWMREHPTGDGRILTGVHVAYLPREKAQTMWGADSDANWAKITAAVSAVRNKALLYGGDVIMACYGDMSSGTTESSADVWGQPLPYLVEVPSPGDAQQKDFLSRVTVGRENFRKTALGLPGAKLGSDPRTWLRVTRRSGAGGVLEAQLGGKTVTGAQLREWFGLRSINFSLSYQSGKFTFLVRGNGHGVGLSQCGAEAMARQGKTWQQILEWYYKGATVGAYDWSRTAGSASPL